jgi:hypothetical protein
MRNNYAGYPPTLRVILGFMATVVLACGVHAQQGTLSDEAKAVCDAHNELPENAVYGTQVAENCYTYARNFPGVVERIDPLNANGKFRAGSYICDRGYYKGYNDDGYIKEGPCVAYPEVEGGQFTGGSPAVLRCDKGYVMVADRSQTHETLLLPHEMSCLAVPPERQNAMNKCPRGTVAVAAMSAKDRRKYPYGTDCAR